jgi:predicted RNA-binding Zn-ribbon protein involved in translation (DUF1610 family)
MTQRPGDPLPPREMPCKLCNGALSVPMDLRVRELTCPHCSRTQSIDAYIPLRERAGADVIRQVAAVNDAKRLQESGVQCKSCGATLALPQDPNVMTFTCNYCGNEQMVSDYVSAQLLAARQLRAVGQRERDKKKKADRIVLVVVLPAVGLLLSILAIVAIVR